jgi:ketosteroid isomerase-like protein
MGNEWARHWNAGDLDGVAAVYAKDAVYLPPHHEAVHGREGDSRVFDGATQSWHL